MDMLRVIDNDSYDEPLLAVLVSPFGGVAMMTWPVFACKSRKAGFQPLPVGWLLREKDLRQVNCSFFMIDWTAIACG